MHKHAYFFPLILLLLTSCIGTDFVDEPLGPVPSRLDLSDESLILLEGESRQLTAQVIASDESILDEAVNWSSRNAGIASINATGLLSAISVGQVWIDVSTQTLADSILVKVSTDPEALASITIGGSQTELSIGDSLQLSVELRNANGEILTGKMVSWSSSDPGICAVDDDGLVTALDNGATQITASSEGVISLPFSLMVGGETLTRSGTFEGANGYNVQGTVTLEQSSDQADVVMGSDFRTQSGPGLYVYLSPNAGNVNGGVNLGKLTSTMGEQTYSIPSNVDPADFDYVLIYCQPFRVPFGNANLQ